MNPSGTSTGSSVVPPDAADSQLSQPLNGPRRSSPLRGGSLSSTNRFAYNVKTGTELGPGLVDETGMGGRLHQMAPAAFLDTVPGTEPNAEQRRKFIKPVIGKDVKSERKLAPIFTRSMNSVLKVAATKTLRVLDTASHKAAVGHNSPKDTLNDAGFYLDTPRARSATDFTPDRKRSRIPLSEQYVRDLGRRSWHWIAVPVELKWSAPSAFYAEDSASKAKEADARERDAGKGTPVDTESNEGAAGTAQMGSVGLPSDPSTPSSEPSVAIPQFEPTLPYSPAVGSPIPPSVSPATPITHPAATAPNLSSAAPVDPAKGKPFVRDTAQGEIALGQFAEYQLNVFTHQHRRFLYGIYVRKKGARMIYCDRTGARVSEEFDWTSKDSFLHTFVWKLAHMSLEELGFDPTAELATDAECMELQGAKGDSALLAHIAEAVNNAFDENYPVYKLRITVADPFPDEAFPAQDPVVIPTQQPSTSAQHATPLSGPTKEEHYFLVARPHFHTDALVGRCTKCYIAYHLDEKRFCFLKDYWRPLVTNRARPEHLVYDRLRSARTPFIASLICGGDVGGPRCQTTQVQDILPSKTRPVPRVHYRIAIAEIGTPLKTFNGFRHLANIFAQAITAHDHAVKYAGVLHRDISVGNIMINSNGDGFLIDWDLSRLVSELGTGPIEPERTGTWQFQSALFLRWPRKPYRTSDDIESFIHAFRYMVLRHHVTKVVKLHTFIETYFENYASVPAVFDDGIRVVKRGGDEKFLHFQTPKSGFTVAGSPKLQALLDKIARRCYESYASLDKGQMDNLYGIVERIPDDQQEEEHPAPPPVQSLNLSWLTEPLPEPPTPIVSLSTTSTSRSDPCEMSGFLADSREVVKVLVAYIADTNSQADQEADSRSKAADEFRRRDVERPRINLPRLENRHISALSTSYTPDSAGSADVFALAVLDDDNARFARAPSSVPSRDPSPHDPSALPSRATSPEPSVAPSSNEPSRQGSPLPRASPIAEPSSEGGMPPGETLGKRRGRTSDVAEAVSGTASGATKASKALPKPLKKPRN
ncbi:hypothetical protein LXA43DRAFT_1103114 [Ganoderma leucocontextum]|nr:hypothetical protein LXA43DRAFT_1103114 [Ganoderma leucocontextum]